MLQTKLDILITKYKNKCNKEITLIDFDSSLIKKDHQPVTKEITEKLSKSCIIIIDTTKNNISSPDMVSYINGLSFRSIIILLVPKGFDFNHFVININSNTIDAINWKNDNGCREDKYLIVVNNINK